MNKIEINKLPELSWEVSEAVNQLRVNLSFCGSDVKTIMVTSSTPNEGKSFVTMQLWKSIAEMGTPALFIDCDFRKSVLRTRYGFSCSGHMKGAPHYLAGQAELEDVIYETNIKNGYIIPVAKTVVNPAILLEPQVCSDDRRVPQALRYHSHRHPAAGQCGRFTEHCHSLRWHGPGDHVRPDSPQAGGKLCGTAQAYRYAAARCGAECCKDQWLQPLL